MDRTGRRVGHRASATPLPVPPKPLRPARRGGDAIQWLLALAVMAAFAGAMPQAGLALQGVAIGLVLLAATVCLVGRRPVWSDLSLLEASLAVFALVSLMHAVWQSSFFLGVYGLTLGLVVLASMVLARTLSLGDLLDAAGWGLLGCVVLALATGAQQLVEALSVTVGAKGLVRFGPLGNHPNLIGYIFGAGCFLLLRMAVRAPNPAMRAMWALATLLALVYIFAASSRAAILGTLVGIVFMAVVELRVLRSGRAALAAGLVLVAAIGSLLIDPVQDYVWDLLELDSARRGVGSGATGRTELWLMGLRAIVADPVGMFIGNGYRSIASLDFPTENSYIAILIDAGVPVGGLMLIGFLAVAVQLALHTMRGLRDGVSPAGLFVASAFVSMFVQAMFNRYLLGIGNSASLILFVIAVAASVQLARPASPRVAAPVPRPMAPARVVPRR